MWGAIVTSNGEFEGMNQSAKGTRPSMHREYESRGIYTHVSSHVYVPALPDSYKGLSKRDGCDRHLGPP